MSIVSDERVEELLEKEKRLEAENARLRAALDKLIFDYEEQLGTEATEARRALEEKGDNE